MASWKFGVREIVALALLGVAVAGGLAVTFLRDDDGSQQDAAERLIEERAGGGPGAANAHAARRPCGLVSD